MEKQRQLYSQMKNTASAYWNRQLPLRESVLHSVQMLADSCGISLSMGKPERGWIGVYPQTKTAVLSLEAFRLIKKYVRVDPEFVDIGLKWAMRHEFWHTKTNPLMANRALRRIGSTSKDAAITILEHQANKKLIHEIFGRKLKDISMYDESIIEEIDRIAIGIVFASVIGSGKSPSHWIKNDCTVSITNDSEFGFLSSDLKVYLNRALKTRGDNVSCMAFRVELERQRLRTGRGF